MESKFVRHVIPDYEIDMSPVSQWRMCFNGDWKYVIHYTKAPNRFHRFMQRILLGIHWKRIKDN